MRVGWSYMESTICWSSHGSSNTQEVRGCCVPRRPKASQGVQLRPEDSIAAHIYLFHTKGILGYWLSNRFQVSIKIGDTLTSCACL